MLQNIHFFMAIRQYNELLIKNILDVNISEFIY